MTNHLEAAARIRAYLDALPNTVNLGAEFAYGKQFRSEAWPHDSYPLTREDVETLLAAVPQPPMDRAATAHGATDVGTEFVHQIDQPDEVGLAAFEAGLANQGNLKASSKPSDRADVRDILLHAIDFTYAYSLGYRTPEALLAAYDATRTDVDRAAIRDRIAALFRHLPDEEPLREATPGEIADAVLAELPAPADRAAVLSPAERTMLTYALNQAQLRIWSVGGVTDEEQAAVVSLRRLAGEAAATETVPESCAHCGKTILRVTGTLAAWWVHDPGGHTVCSPEQAASSPRATPKAADEAQPAADEEA